MKKLLVALLVLACLVVIALPAWLTLPEALPAWPPTDARPTPPRSAPTTAPSWQERGAPRLLFQLDNPLTWMRFSPFGAHAHGPQALFSAAAAWVYLYLTAALVLVLIPRRVRLITRMLQSATWRDRGRMFLAGLLAMVASVSLGLLARYAFVWFVLIIILSSAVILLSFLGIFTVGLMIGGAVGRWSGLRPSPWIELALGSLILFALGRIPFAGWVLFGVVSAWGLGAVLLSHLGSGEAWSLRDWQAE